VTGVQTCALPISWNVGLGRELTPAEAMGIMRLGKGKKGKKKKR
jgi:hypothetical protein